MLVSDIMSSPAIIIGPDEDLGEATRILDQDHITSIPVVSPDRELLGVIGEADIFAQLTSRGSRAPSAGGGDGPVLVRDAMRRDALTADPDEEIADVIAVLARTGLASLPVIVKGRVRGVVSRSDIIHALAHGPLDRHPRNEPSSRSRTTRHEGRRPG